MTDYLTRINYPRAEVKEKRVLLYIGLFPAHKALFDQAESRVALAEPGLGWPRPIWNRRRLPNSNAISQQDLGKYGHDDLQRTPSVKAAEANRETADLVSSGPRSNRLLPGSWAVICSTSAT